MALPFCRLYIVVEGLGQNVRVSAILFEFRASRKSFDMLFKY